MAELYARRLEPDGHLHLLSRLPQVGIGIVVIVGKLKPIILLCTFRARLSKNRRKNDHSVLEKTSRGLFFFFFSETVDISQVC